MATTHLRDVITNRLNLRWDEWAKDHPHLAAAIDRTRLIDSAVQKLRDDPQFVAAMQQARLDESKLAAAATVFERLEHLIGRLLA